MALVADAKLEAAATDAERKLHIRRAKIHAERLRQKMLHAQSLQELALVRTGELFSDELQKNLTRAESRFKKSKRNKKGRKLVMSCPSCGAKLQYRERARGKTVACPQSKCGKPVLIPSD